MISFIFFVVALLILLFLFSNTFRTWVLMLLVRRIQRSAEEQMRQTYQAGQQQRQTEPAFDEEAETASDGKVEMDEIARRRINTPHKEDYVDFEELPK